MQERDGLGSGAGLHFWQLEVVNDECGGIHGLATVASYNGTEGHLEKGAICMRSGHGTGLHLRYARKQ